MAQQLHELLLKEISEPSGLVPLFGIEQRDTVVLERLQSERRLAGYTLQNIAALLETMDAVLVQKANDSMSTPKAFAELKTIHAALKAELECNEIEVITGNKEYGWQSF